jgi:serine protease Do
MRKTLLLVALAASVASGGAFADERLWTEEPVADGLSPEDPLQIKTFSRLARAVTPAVVRIVAHKEVTGEDGGSHHHHGQGTGFFIRGDGLLLTNDHVVEGAGRVTAVLASGDEVEAAIVGRDLATDLALLRVKSAGVTFPVAALGDSDAVEVGDFVLAIGAPFGLDHTVTMGIVSATGRRDVRPSGARRFYADFIQTDASINRGSSGGPLVGIDGRVVGINAAINRKGQGIGFVIPVNMVKVLLPQLASGTVTRAWLGVRFAQVDRELALQNALDGRTGAAVASVFPGGPADRAGLQRGDVIRAFDGQPVTRHDDLPWLVSVAGVGRTIEVSYVRAGAEHTADVTLDALPGEPHGATSGEPAP